MQSTEAQTSKPFSMEGRRVLVLDAAYQPVSIVSWKKAFVLLYVGQAKAVEDRRFKKPEVVAYSNDGAVVGVHRDIPVPSVIQLGTVVPRHRQRVRFCRKNVLVGRDRGICQYCHKRFPTEDLTIDHVVPKAQGGKTCWENVAAACVSCNQRKGGRTPEQAGMKLMRQPTKPKTIVEVAVKMDFRHVPPEWRDYWDTSLEGA